MGEPVATTKIVLKHQQVQVDYTLGATPTLVYQDGSSAKTFAGSEILTDQTGLGTLISVALVLTIDVGGEVRVLHPAVRPRPGAISRLPHRRRVRKVQRS